MLNINTLIQLRSRDENIYLHDYLKSILFAENEDTTDVMSSEMNTSLADSLPWSGVAVLATLQVERFFRPVVSTTSGAMLAAGGPHERSKPPLFVSCTGTCVWVTGTRGVTRKTMQRIYYFPLHWSSFYIHPGFRETR